MLVYDNFAKPGGYTIDDYAKKWTNTFGPLEMADGHDTRNFASNAFNVSAAPFRTAVDFSVFDHLKYFAASNQSFPVPTVGSVDRYPAHRRDHPRHVAQPHDIGDLHPVRPAVVRQCDQTEQADAVTNVVDFSTGQLFDWFVAGHSVMALIERLPSNVTGSPDFVGTRNTYTQIIKAAPAAPGPHAVSIRFSRGANGIGHADYYLDGALFAHVDHVGIPLDRQSPPVAYEGSYPSLGAGEELESKVNSLTIGHGLFSLLDAFPFQHPDSPELAVSVPLSQRAFGQGVTASFDDFKVKTVR